MSCLFFITTPQIHRHCYAPKCQSSLILVSINDLPLIHIVIPNLVETSFPYDFNYIAVTIENVGICK